MCEKKKRKYIEKKSINEIKSETSKTSRTDKCAWYIQQELWEVIFCYLSYYYAQRM